MHDLLGRVPRTPSRSCCAFGSIHAPNARRFPSACTHGRSESGNALGERAARTSFVGRIGRASHAFSPRRADDVRQTEMKGRWRMRGTLVRLVRHGLSHVAILVLYHTVPCAHAFIALARVVAHVRPAAHHPQRVRF